MAASRYVCLYIFVAMGDMIFLVAMGYANFLAAMGAVNVLVAMGDVFGTKSKLLFYLIEILLVLL